VKSKRRPLQASHTNWSTVIDEPSPDDLPSRDVQDDGAETPFGAASRVFSALTTTAMSPASTLGDLAASVFTPKPQEVQEQAPDQPAAEKGRTGRILPSLLPLNQFEAPLLQDEQSVRKQTKKRPRKRVIEVAEQQEAPEPTEVAADPAVRPTIETGTAAALAPRHARKPNRRRAEARVRAGEGWKRRRLPKACW